MDFLPDICAPAGAYAAIPIVYSSLEMCAKAFVSAFLALFSTETRKTYFSVD